MNRNAKKLLALLLCLVMVMSFFPMAYAEDGEEEGSISLIPEELPEEEPAEDSGTIRPAQTAPAGEKHSLPQPQPDQGKTETFVPTRLSDEVLTAGPETYTDIALGDEKTVTISEGGQLVWFRFIPAESGPYAFRSSGTGCDPYAELYDEDMVLLLENDDGGESVNFHLAYSFVAGKTYYFAARLYSSESTGTYTVALLRDPNLRVKSPWDEYSGNVGTRMELPYGESATLDKYSGVVDYGTVTYQWYTVEETDIHITEDGYYSSSVNFTPIPGETSPSYTTPPVTEYGQYELRITDENGRTLTAFYWVYVETGFRASTRRIEDEYSQTYSDSTRYIRQGEAIALYTFTRIELGGLHFQWWTNGEPIEGETSPTITVDYNELFASGFPGPVYYGCLISDDYGATEALIYRLYPGEAPNAIPVDEEHFPDPVFNSFVRYYYDADESGSLDEGERNIESMNVVDCGIQTLQGIEYFTSLNGLDCSFNSIQELDLSGLTNLYYLYCEGNQLTSLNLTGDTNLHELYCMDNQLTTLDLQGQDNLEYLYCSGNSIASLNLSGKSKLVELCCNDNEIESLDLSGMPRLEYVDCPGNQLSSLTLNGLPRLRHFGGNDNRLTSLTLNDLPELEILYCGNNRLASLRLNGLTALTELQCYDNLLTSLDLSGLPELLYLDCAGNRLTGVDVSGLSKLETLGVARNQLGRLDVSALPALSCLWCDYNRLTSLDLSRQTQMTELYCQDNQLSSLNLGANPDLGNLFANDNALQTLDISGCRALLELCTEEHLNPNSAVMGMQRYGYYGSNEELGACFYEWVRLDADTRLIRSAEDLEQPAVLVQPESLSLSVGDTARFTVGGSGGGLSYQWQWRSGSSGTWANSSAEGNKTSCLSVGATASRNGYQYRCKLSNAKGSVTSEAAVLTVSALPVLLVQPVSVTAYPGAPTTFSVKASGTGLSYQWQWSKDSGKTWSNSSSATAGYNTDTLTITASASRSGYRYRCQVTNSAGTVNSEAAVLTVSAKPVIMENPYDATTTAGVTASFLVKAVGEDLSYQWQWSADGGKTWKNSSSATVGYNEDLLFVAVQASRDGYQYRCKVSNSAGSVVSEPATLYVSYLATIYRSPRFAIAKEGETAEFSVEAVGPDLSYRWQWSADGGKTWNNSSSSTAGYNTNTLQVVATAARDGNFYRCALTTSGGTIYSSPAQLMVITKPKITSQPQSVTVSPGTVAFFSVSAESYDQLSYQWQWSKDGGKTWNDSGSATTGYQSDTLQVVATAARNGYQYRCKVSNSAGEVISKAATLTVGSLPVITADPEDFATAVGATAVFSVKASGADLSYQWQWSKNGGNTWSNSSSATEGYNTANLKVTATLARSGYRYRCKVSNSFGSVFSREATLTVLSGPIISGNPQNVTAAVNETAIFTVEAIGADLTYQWQWSRDGGKTWNNSSSATVGYNTEALRVVATAARNGYLYRCKVTNSGGSRFSEPALLTVTAGPVITADPEDCTTTVGAMAVFSVKASGSDLSYQWQWSKDGGKTWNNSSSATVGYNTEALRVVATAARNGYLYRCKVTNSGGTAISESALLTVH